MNKEVKRICEDQGYEINHPRRLTEDLFRRKNIELNRTLYDFYTSQRNDDLSGQIEAIINNLYIVIDICARMGIQPDGILDAFIKNKVNNESDSNEVKVHISGLSDREVNMMKNYRYAYSDDSDVIESYLKLKEVFDNRKIPYNSEVNKLSRADFERCFIALVNVLTNYQDSLDVKDDAYRLGNLLYHDLYTLIQMGVSPDYIQEKLEEKMQIEAKRR